MSRQLECYRSNPAGPPAAWKSAVFILALAPAWAMAGRYEIVSGQGVEVCDAYQRNLNSFRPSVPMREERPINPELKDFSKPDWVQLEPSSTVVPKIDDFLWKRDANPAYYVADWRGTKQQLARAKRAFEDERAKRFWGGRAVANVDIDNDGSVESLYRDHASNGILLLVLTDDMRNVDARKTPLVMRHPSRSAEGGRYFRPRYGGIDMIGDQGSSMTLVEDAIHYAHYDVFLYKDKAYFDLWWDQHPTYKGQLDMEVGHLHVFQAAAGHVSEVCTYRFATAN